MHMTFNVGYESHGFRDSNERPELAYNGTFFDSTYFPYIGYNRNVELDDPRRRAEEKLPALEEMAARGDSYWERVNLFYSAIRLDHLPHRRQHFGRSGRHRSRLPQKRVDRKWPPLLRIRYGRDSHWPISFPISPAATR